MFRKLSLLLLMTIVVACSRDNVNNYSTTGTIEAYQVDVRSPVAGQVLYSKIAEGTSILSGAKIAVIDTTTFHLQIMQLQKQLDGIDLQFESIQNKEHQLQTRLQFLQKQYNRFSHLVASEGVAQSKADEIETERDVVRIQMEDIPNQRRQLHNKKEQLQSQIDLLDYRIAQSTITAPVSGVLLERFIHTGEQVQSGHLLTTIGVTDTVWVMMYLPEPLLSQVHIGSEIPVRPDGMQTALKGKVSWIAQEAEFTPKTVYTEDTRTSLTYGVRVRIPNEESTLKIGMPVILELPQDMGNQ